MTTISKQQSAAAPAHKNGFSLISNEKLLQLYSAMLRCRMIEERARLLFKQGKFTGNYHPAVGREAAAVGAAIDLGLEDTLVSSRPCFITAFLQGQPLDRLFARPAAPSNIATGAARTNKAKNNGKIAVAFCGDGPASPDSWRQAMKLAGVHGLPMIFVCQSGLRTEPATPNAQTRVKNLASKAQACGFPVIPVDGNDVVAVYRVASEAIAHARKGNGPTLIECKAFRLHGRSLTDSRKKRNPDEIEPWEPEDPILNMEKYLAAKGLFREKFKLDISSGFSEELNAAIEAAERSRLSEGKR
jgi:TPP-dependent pyruvate/acetoin dehydrogenase alpha subunit